MKPNKPNLDREDAWMQLLETAVIFGATWLNPQAGVAIFLLKLCFQALKILRHHHRPHNNHRIKDDRDRSNKSGNDMISSNMAQAKNLSDSIEDNDDMPTEYDFSKIALRSSEDHHRNE